MKDRNQSIKSSWRTAPELPHNVFAVWHKPDRALNPVAVVATVDPDGAPRAAPFGSLRAVTPTLLRLASWHGHNTYANLCRDNRVTVALLAPNSAVSVQGRARIVKEQMKADEHYSIVEVDIEKVKNDMVRRITINTAVTISVLDEYQDWFQAVLGELEE